MITINQVLLLKDPAYSTELGEALWAAFREVENFYNEGEKRADFRRFYMSEAIPDSISKKDSGCTVSPLQKMRYLFSGVSVQPVGGKDWELTRTISQSDKQWTSTEGQFIRNYDSGRIARMAWELAVSGPDKRSSGNSTMQVVVTDLVLTPPPGWRYIIRSRDVVSIAPTDPQFWHMKDPNRNAIVKHRVRTACLAVVGQLLGLEQCDNERCFLFRNVDSVTRLDDMVVLGPEHNIPALSERGFEIIARNPRVVQEITHNPQGDAGVG